MKFNKIFSQSDRINNEEQNHNHSTARIIKQAFILFLHVHEIKRTKIVSLRNQVLKKYIRGKNKINYDYKRIKIQSYSFKNSVESYSYYYGIKLFILERVQTFPVIIVIKINQIFWLCGSGTITTRFGVLRR
jgi:hypothetical protein